jgi:hypothetical protein
MSSPAKNTSDSPQVIDDDGHIIGGGEWGAVDPDSERVKDLVAAGLIVIKDAGPKDGTGAAGEPAGEATPAPSAGSKAVATKEKI